MMFKIMLWDDVFMCENELDSCDTPEEADVLKDSYSYDYPDNKGFTVSIREE